MQLRQQLKFRIIQCLIFNKNNRKMSWMSSGSSNDELIENLKGRKNFLKYILIFVKFFKYIFSFSGNGIIKSNKVARVMKTVDRGDFTQKSGHAYQDSPQLIGYGVTISAPHMVRKRKYFLFAKNFS